ncbi:PREDICTED: uncharacterized protein LOC109215370 [Nicotiana attenuata]|uniref:uncharacterized protein LOC109215370 n=1 Tax=Nicotiana attenuata TaxID=49451 RepID=UPI0009053E8E|nr:PREDICTED: uncharacterized protein LOC109215370 [Nicotiana attenuata]
MERSWFYPYSFWCYPNRFNIPRKKRSTCRSSTFSSRYKIFGVPTCQFGYYRSYLKCRDNLHNYLPNFNMSLYDPYLTEALKIQVQIQGAPQAKDSIQATIHHQIAWRVQNHAMDLCLPGGENALLLNIDATKGNTTCTQIPRQISRDELVKILPDSWITNYEKLREPEESLQSGEPTFTKRSDKTVCISFDHSHLKKPNKTIFSCQVIQPKDTTDTYPEPDGEFF